MKNLKIWMIPLAVAIIGLIFLMNSKDSLHKTSTSEGQSFKESSSTSKSSHSFSFKVEPKVTFARVQRLGINATSLNHPFWESVTTGGPAVDTLKAIRPSYIRTAVCSPSLFTACEEVQANPWIVLPENFSSNDYSKVLVTLLREYADESRFSEIALEVKSELDKTPETPREDAFSAIVDEVSPTTLIRKVIVSDVNPNIHEGFDTIALPEKTVSDSRKLETLFKEYASPSSISLKPLKKSLAIYEEGPLYTSFNQASGADFAKKTLERLYEGTSYQLVYWDETAIPYPTPTTLATILLNQVLGGSLHRVTSLGNANSPFTIAAFRTADEWNLAVVNSSHEPQHISIEFPEDERQLPQVVAFLSAPSPLADNEEMEQVTISSQEVKSEGRHLQYTVPPYSLCSFTTDRDFY